ncbi:hypothetical protein BJ912DRAFT_1065042 [Pholiota molesta]|nr:hypothetical protein BJ912DRAFT_1065042 [Pholiota molesta]
MPPPVWGHNFFMEHPSAKILPKVRDAYTSDKMDRKKGFCIRCYQAFFQAELASDDAAMRAQMRASVRDKGMIDAALWGDATKYIVLRQENIHRHLRTCQYQPQAIKDQANAELTTRQGGWRAHMLLEVVGHGWQEWLSWHGANASSTWRAQHSDELERTLYAPSRSRARCHLILESPSRSRRVGKGKGEPAAGSVVVDLVDGCYGVVNGIMRGRVEGFGGRERRRG